MLRKPTQIKMLGFSSRNTHSLIDKYINDYSIIGTEKMKEKFNRNKIKGKLQ